MSTQTEPDPDKYSRAAAVVFCVTKRVSGFFQVHQGKVSEIYSPNVFKFTENYVTGTHVDGYSMLTIL